MTAILGISAFYHDSAAALVVDGQLVAAAQEERFTRKKHDSEFPLHAIEYCLRAGNLEPGQLDYVGFYDKPLVKLRSDMERFGIVQADNASYPEDHIAAVAEMMAGLITGAFGAPVPLAQQKQFFETHLEPWAGRFFADIEQAASARFYKPVGAAGRLFLTIEAEAFALTT